MALPVLQHGYHSVLRQPILAGEGGKLLPSRTMTVIPSHTPFCSEPQMSFSILQHAPHTIVRQAILHGEGGKLLPGRTMPIIPTYLSCRDLLLTSRPKPQMSFSILQNEPNIIVRQAIFCGEGDKLRAVIPTHAPGFP